MIVLLYKLCKNRFTLRKILDLSYHKITHQFETCDMKSLKDLYTKLLTATVRYLETKKLPLGGFNKFLR